MIEQNDVLDESTGQLDPGPLAAIDLRESEHVEDDPRALVAAFRKVSSALEGLTDEGRDRVLSAAMCLWGKAVDR